MNPMPLAQLARIIEAEPLTPMPAEPVAVSAVSHDSRRVPPNALFVAIRGETFDGHDFVANAARAGALAAVVERRIDPPPNRFPQLRVDSSRKALARLARHVRQGLAGTVIAVAGSNGKTSTKRLIHSVLSKRLRGSMSPKSFNNDIGVPTTILAADPEDDFLVLEMGTNHPGEIAALTQIGLPDLAVLTCCAEEHLEFLGDLDGVARENASIIQGMSADGVLIVNGDDRRLLQATASFGGRRITFGFDPSNDLVAGQVRSDSGGTHFHLNGAGEFFVPMLGHHSASNGLAAIAVGQVLGLTRDEIAAGLAAARGPEMRLELKDVSGVRVLNDAYNANPGSMRSAMRTFGMLSSSGRKIAVMGEMRELGARSAEHHREAGRLAAAAEPDLLVCVGVQGKLIAESARQAGLSGDVIRWFADADAAAAAVPSLLRRGDLVLLKASRAVKLERVMDAIAEHSERSASRDSGSRMSPMPG